MAFPAGPAPAIWMNCWAGVTSCASLPGLTASSWTAAQRTSPRSTGPLTRPSHRSATSWGGPARIAAALTEAGLFLGSVIVATVPGARWRLWPNGHPVVRLASERDLDVTAMASDRVTNGAPLLADIYASAVAGPSS